MKFTASKTIRPKIKIKDIYRCKVARFQKTRFGLSEQFLQMFLKMHRCLYVFDTVSALKRLIESNIKRSSAYNS